MKKEILSAIGIIAGILFGTTLSLSAQEKLSLKQCREMALKYNKEMAAADRQTEAARLMSLSYKANFFPNFTANGTGIYSTADGSLGIPGGNLPVFMPNPTTGELVSSGFAYFPGLNLDYKVGTVYSGDIQLEMSVYTCLVSLLPEHLRFQIIRESFQSDLILFAADFHIFFRLFQ